MKNINQILTELINCNSFNTESNLPIVQKLEQMFNGNCTEIKRIQNLGNPNKFSLLIGINTPLCDVNNAIVLAGHMDTVLPSKGNEHATTVGGKIYGLGACDMKAFFASIISILPFLRQYSRPVIVAITADEETKLQGVREVLQCFKFCNIHAAFAVIGEPTSSNFAVANKGCYEYELIVKGHSCHSSQPQNGINAISIAAKVIVLLEKINKQGMLLGYSCNVGVISGGKVANQVPDLCSLRFDLRVMSHEQAKMALRKINAKIKALKQKYQADIKLNLLLQIPPFEQTDTAFKKAILHDMPRQTFVFSGGSEAGFYQQAGADAIIYGCGDLAVAHSHEEHVCTSELLAYASGLVQLLQSISAVK